MAVCYRTDFKDSYSLIYGIEEGGSFYMTTGYNQTSRLPYPLPKGSYKIPISEEIAARYVGPEIYKIAFSRMIVNVAGFNVSVYPGTTKYIDVDGFCVAKGYTNNCIGEGHTIERLRGSAILVVKYPIFTVISKDIFEFKLNSDIKHVWGTNRFYSIIQGTKVHIFLLLGNILYNIDIDRRCISIVNRDIKVDADWPSSFNKTFGISPDDPDNLDCECDECFALRNVKSKRNRKKY